MLLRSLRAKIVLLFLVIILYSGITISINIYNKSEAIILNSVGEQARSITERATQILSNETYASVVNTMLEDESYFELREQLNELREVNGLKYLYTMKADTSEAGLYTYVVDGMPLNAVADDVSSIGDEVEDPDAGTIKAFTEHTVVVGELDYSDLYGATITTVMPIFFNGEFLGVVGADFDASSIHAQLQQLKRNITVNLLVIFAFATVISIFLSNIIVRPIRTIIKDLKRVAEGDLTVQVKTNARNKDEIGQLRLMFNNMATELRQMIVTIQSNVAILHESISILSTNIRASNELSIQVSSHLEVESQQSKLQHNAIEQTTRSLAEVGAGMTRIATTAEGMLSIATSARQLSTQGNEHIDKLSEQMNSIIQAEQRVGNDVVHLINHSQHINEILDVMKNITSQTGLLALNASIEAARAGEHGRGFSVVAQQIRKLAEQSKQSAEQVSSLIQDIVETTARVSEATQLTSKEIASGSESLTQTASTFLAINQEISDVTNQANELSAISEEIEATTQEVSLLAQNVTDIAEKSLSASTLVKKSVTHQIESVSQSNEMLEKLKEQADELTSYIQRFKVNEETE